MTESIQYNAIAISKLFPDEVTQIAKSREPSFLPEIVLRYSNLPPTHHFTLSNLSMLRSWLGSGPLRSLHVLRLNRTLPARNAFSSSTRYLASPAPAPTSADRVPLRKQLKQEAKALRSHKRQRKEIAEASKEEWELTVGVEVHAQLDTETKLFSRASTSTSDVPNSNVALFDLAFPGSQPIFQAAILLPAIRAALALNCEIQPISRFDRKHYFYQDQPSGYQITQYYEPLARNGYIDLFDYDGIAPEDGERVRIDIKQVQLEQDTAKSQDHPPTTQLIDYNRVSHPLIEIITMPQIHTPATAAACVRKLQSIVLSCGAVTTGMELGGLRADVNVSVRRRGEAPGGHQYNGIGGLGQRTEIKNLSSFKAVEDAIIAEKNRQIEVLESGGVVEGETRGWTIGSSETRRLRGKEGSVDYRYMPDPDIPPLIIGEDLLSHLKDALPTAPDELLTLLVGSEYNLPIEDAKPLIELDNGARLEYYHDVVDLLRHLQSDQDDKARAGLARVAGNWVLHELGGLMAKHDRTWDAEIVPAESLAHLIDQLLRKRITGPTAKSVLATVFDGDRRSVPQLLEEENLLLRPLSREEYVALAESVIAMNPQLVEQIRSKNQLGKLGWFVGQMMRTGEKGRVEAPKAEQILRELILG
ncbi:Aspartyl/glutamyl-tRNA(Asn/Gln) amidotransferase B subunit [Penicillium sp. DV-2018c]|nr:Aspartyl/glutamyl-tRNA(Asn/Gln) amidotransferase B subunit [Penicillium sp. DV-2018c]